MMGNKCWFSCFYLPIPLAASMWVAGNTPLTFKLPKQTPSYLIHTHTRRPNDRDAYCSRIGILLFLHFLF